MLLYIFGEVRRHATNTELNYPVAKSIKGAAQLFLARYGTYTRRATNTGLNYPAKAMLHQYFEQLASQKHGIESSTALISTISTILCNGLVPATTATVSKISYNMQKGRRALNSVGNLLNETKKESDVYGIMHSSTFYGRK